MKILLSFFFLYTSLFANIILIDNNTTNINILKNSYCFFDKESKKDPTTICKLDASAFKNINNNMINKGYIFADTLWIKFTLKNNSPKSILRELVFDEPNIDILNLYYHKHGKLIETKNGIFNRKIFNDELAFHFPLSLKSHKEQTYFLRVRDMTHSLHFSLHVKSYKKFKDDDMKQQIALSIFFAILFVIIFYSSVIYLYSKEKIYLYYSFFVATIFLHHLSLRGMIAYFTPSSLIIEQAYMPPYYLALTMLSIILFINKFLNLHKYKKIFFGIKLFIVYMLILIIFNSKETYLLSYLTPAAMLEVLYLEAVGCYLYWYKKEKYAKYFFFIWSISLFGILLTILYYEGIYTHPIPFLMEITFVGETLLFSIVLSSYIKDLKVEKLQKKNLLLEQSKMASMGSMLQNIAHQWRQPLGEINSIVMKIDADLYEQKSTPKTIESDLHSIETITSHLSNTIESLTAYSKKEKIVQTTSLQEALEKSMKIMGTQLQDVKVNIEIEKNVEQQFNLNEMMQVLLVILNNAVAAFSEKKIENKELFIRVFQEEKRNILTIEDTAGGIEEKDLVRVFEPYFTTKFESQGVGIGLYMAKTIVESYGGNLTVSNTNNGAKFTIQL